MGRKGRNNPEEWRKDKRKHEGKKEKNKKRLEWRTGSHDRREEINVMKDAGKNNGEREKTNSRGNEEGRKAVRKGWRAGVKA